MDGVRERQSITNDLVGAILAAKCHIIVTLRAKDAYELEEYTKRNGERGIAPKNVGIAPVMHKGFGYEMQLIIRMTDLTAYIQASGVEDYIHKGEEIERPGPELAYRLLEALDGVEPPAPLPTQAELYADGGRKGMWRKGEAFYARVSAHLGGIPVSAAAWEKLTREQILSIQQMIEDESARKPKDTEGEQAS
jgi:hypothetical protein